jgi:hypothetical protein
LQCARDRFIGCRPKALPTDLATDSALVDKLPARLHASRGYRTETESRRISVSPQLTFRDRRDLEGTMWRFGGKPPAAGASYDFKAVSCTSAKACEAVGDSDAGGLAAENPPDVS